MKEQPKNLLYPDAEALKKLKKRLPKFKPTNLGRLFKLEPAQARAKGVALISEAMEEQYGKLLDALQLDRADPDRWQKGFQVLAMIHHGAGHFILSPPREGNRNASIRKHREYDRSLYEFMQEAKKSGIKTSDALKAIAKDPKKYSKLGLRTHKLNDTSDQTLRYQTLEKRWNGIQKRAAPGSLLEAIIGDYPEFGSEKDQKAWLSNRPALPAVGFRKSNKQ